MQFAYAHSTKDGAISTSAGSATKTIYLSNSMIYQIVIKPGTADTSYDITLTDVRSVDILKETERVGEMNELIQLPALGNLTMTISNASNDEVFTYYVVAQD